MTTIAVTGASGDLGSSFITHAAETFAIKALVRKGTSIRPSNDTNVTRFYFQDGYTYESDLLNQFTDSDIVIHCAALLNASQDQQIDLVDYFAVNAFLTAVLAAACVNNEKPPKFIYVSSEMIYSLSNNKALKTLVANFIAFCEERIFAAQPNLYNLRSLAIQFLKENRDFPYEECNIYALTKYLGETIIAHRLPRAAILRVTNAYGPDYDNLRLIPRLIIGRLTGHGATYNKEQRDFVYAADINTLINTIIQDDVVGTVDCRSGESTDIDSLSELIIQLTPTAYGKLTGIAAQEKRTPQSVISPGERDLAALIGTPTPFVQGLAATLRHHKEQCYHQMRDTRMMEDFLQPGDRIVKDLKGSSAAYLFVVADQHNALKVRKVAIRDGVEGNGVAKVTNEIRYYQHIAQHKPELAALYPKLLDFQTDPAFSSETIEYLDGPNYYAALKNSDLTFDEYKSSFRRFINALCACALNKISKIDDPERSLDAYYIERSLSRLQPIRSLIEVQDTVSINGRQLLAPHVILADLMQNQQLRHFVLPRIECFCFHGDLTLLNTVLLTKTQEIRLIDPRGSTSAWDPLYDFAKLKFTLSGFGEFILNPGHLVKESGDGFVIDPTTIPPSVRRLHNAFFDILAQDKLFGTRIIQHEPYWRYRIAFAEATHYLADIPFRLFTDSTTWTAVASYVVGTYYLNQVYEALKHELTINRR